MKGYIGIFWVIEGRIYASKERVDEQAISRDRRVMLTGILDSSFAHFEEWEKGLQYKYPQADFAVYPRGRVVYSVAEKQYILYLDECITNGEVQKIVQEFALPTYRIDYDEHYTCDGCLCEKGEL